MATQKLNSRSPYFVTSTGAEGTPEQDLSINIVQVNADGTERNSPGVGTFGANITLRAKPVNFVPTGTYTWAGGSSTGTSQDITFTETQGGGAAQQALPQARRQLQGHGRRRRRRRLRAS